MTVIPGFSGAVIAPDSDGFDAARASYGAPDTRPALVVRPSGPADVAAALGYARAEGLGVAVRSGGHSMYSGGDDLLVIDLRALDTVEVLDDARVRLGAGGTWGEVATELGRHGLALTSGDTRSVGVGGIALGGGIGWMVRGLGLAVDNLVEAEVVLPSGRAVTASADSEPELFWALRGGGGNFGVVTSFTFRAHRLDGVVAGSVALDGGDLRAALTGWRDVMRAAPEALNTTFLALPSFEPGVPAGIQVGVCFAGSDQRAADAALAPLLALPTVTGSDIRPMPYADLLEEAHPPGGPVTVVDNNAFADQLGDELIDGLVRYQAGLGPSVLMIRWLTGAFNRVDASATAIAHRGAEVFLVSAAFLMPDAPAGSAAEVDAAWASMSPHLVGRYGNFSNRRGGQVEHMFPASTLERLRAAKRRYDPENLLRENHNIKP